MFVTEENCIVVAVLTVPAFYLIDFVYLFLNFVLFFCFVCLHCVVLKGEEIVRFPWLGSLFVT